MPSRAAALAALLGAAPAALAAAQTAPAADAALEAVQVDPATGLLRDARGRARIFHGMNVVYKEAPWYPPAESSDLQSSLDAHTMDLMRKWGFNVVRLGVMWPGVEPRHGEIDEAYLREMVNITGELSKRGVYTLVDLHQDVGSRRFCGEGFPEYYIDALEADPQSQLARAPAFPKPLNYDLPTNASTKVPELQDCLKYNFGQYYLTNSVGAMWNQLYTPGTPMNQGFLRYWKAVAGAFAGRPEGMGYELLNEPNGFCLGDGSLSCAQAPGTMTTNDVEVRKLTPLYLAAAEVIRTLDRETPLFYEATLPPKLVDVFPAPALGPNETQQGLAYHIYCMPGEDAGTMASAECLLAQNIYTKLYYGFLQKHRGVAGFMTEFGAIGGSPKELEHLNRLLGLADSQFQSWAYWMPKTFHDFTSANLAESLWDAEGHLELAKLKALSRTYAPAIAGTPSKMAFDPKTGVFELAFTATVADAPTEVYLNEELHYPHGFSLDVAPAGCLAQRQAEPNYLQLSLADTAACRGAAITVKIAPKPAPVAALLV